MKKIEHPYKEYERTQLWRVIDQSIQELIKNKDIDLTTRKEYVIGYLCEKIKLKYEKDNVK